MDFQGLKELILTIDKTSIESVEIENKDMKVKVIRSREYGEKLSYCSDIKKNDKAKEKSEILEIKNQDDLGEIYILNSPIVGVYYEAPSPNADSFVKVGDKVKKGQPLCIIEAMKLMNEIESEVSGEVLEILVENEEVVEYGQPLIKIRR